MIWLVRHIDALTAGHRIAEVSFKGGRLEQAAKEATVLRALCSWNRPNPAATGHPRDAYGGVQPDHLGVGHQLAVGRALIGGQPA